MKIAIGADCLGFALKERVAAWLATAGIEVVDVGIYSSEADEKLMDYADSVAGKVAAGEVNRGILICMSGGMMLIRANRWQSVRAVMGFGAEAMKHDRAASDANVVCFGAEYIDWGTVEAVLKAFIETPFDPLERRMRRLAALERPAGETGRAMA